MRCTVRKAQTVGGKVQMWETVTPGWEDLTVVNWANYLLALNETPAGGYAYVGDWPAALTTPGWYFVDIYRGTAIDSALAATQFGYWDGTTFHLGAADLEEWRQSVPLALSSSKVRATVAITDITGVIE